MSTLQAENHLKILRLLVKNPNLSQRELASVLGVSLGKTNYCLKALVGKGLVKIYNFHKSKKKLSYMYLLTPLGFAEKANLTAQFLRYKLAEFDRLNLEILLLKKEVGDGPCGELLNSGDIFERDFADSDKGRNA